MGWDTLCGWERKAPRYQSMAKSRPCRCGTDLEGDELGAGKQVQSSLLGAGGAPARPRVQGRVPAVGSGRDFAVFFKSQGWSNTLSHQRCLAHPIRETVALIKPKRNLN